MFFNKREGKMGGGNELHLRQACVVSQVESSIIMTKTVTAKK